jgi:tRNA(Ile)-lysidine synthase
MQPLGMKGSKKVSDILIDAKVPRIEKEAVWVLESASNICAILGLGICDWAKVNQQTKEVLVIQWKP